MLEKEIERLIGDNLIADSLVGNGKDYILRKHQIDILKDMIKKYDISNNYLCEMAPGTGKTILLMAALKLLLKSGLVKKAMILVDRIAVEEQLIQSINKVLPEYSISKFRKSYESEDCNINIDTIQFLRRKEVEINFEETKIDLLVFFGIHQYLSDDLLAKVKPFKGFRLGILDNSQFIISNNVGLFDNQEMEDTYGYFDKKLGEPDYKYTLKDAVLDGNIINPIYINNSIDIEDNIYISIILKDTTTINKNYYLTLKNVESLINNLRNKEIENKELVEEFIKNGITKEDIRDFSYKKEQLNIFNKLLNNPDYFNNIKLEKGSSEKVWQEYFEANKWIFGYGLNFIFNTSLNDKKLEQVVSGYSFNDYGKRIDALMYSKGIINSFIFVEIKHNQSKLLETQSYREGCWQISHELSGAVSQVQKSVQKAITTIRTKTEILSKNGEPTGETIYLYQPKAFIVIGDMKEFLTDKGINEEKFSSFELFRKGLLNIEILTYDELYNRAKYIIEKANSERN